MRPTRSAALLWSMTSAAALSLATLTALPAVAIAPAARALAEALPTALGEASALEIVAAWIWSLLLALAWALVR